MKLIKNLIWSKKVSSTNSLVPLLPKESLILAGSQSQGRGRQGRTWVSSHKGLFFSFELPNGLTSTITPLSIGASLHLALKEFSEEQLFLKWPNDIVSVQAKKLCGILIETHKKKTIVGIGVNLSDPGLDIATFLKIQTEELLILKEIVSAIENNLHNPNKVILKYWEKHSLLKKGISSKIRLPNGEFKNVKILGLNDEGYLLVKEEGKSEITISALDSIS
ncbi:MAG TPA: biotin--[acetyl-CoA-carboxylase] ligase [Vampirovibrionales bacterium]